METEEEEIKILEKVELEEVQPPVEDRWCMRICVGGGFFWVQPFSPINLSETDDNIS